MLLLFTLRVKKTCEVSDQSSVEPGIVVSDLGLTAEVLARGHSELFGVGLLFQLPFHAHSFPKSRGKMEVLT